MFILIGKFYLVDSGYANEDCFLGPYRGLTYHVQEFSNRRGGLRGPQEVFNYTHSSLRNCIERTFGVWKARFPILKRMHAYPIQKQVMIPIACAVIHNFIKVVRDMDPLMEQYYQDGVAVVEIEPENAETSEENIHETPDGPSVPGCTVSREDMGRFRDQMAQQMWEAFATRPWYR